VGTRVSLFWQGNLKGNVGLGYGDPPTIGSYAKRYLSNRKESRHQVITSPNWRAIKKKKKTSSKRQ